MDDHIIQLSRSLPILQSQLNKNLARKMLTIFGKCSALFDGRIKSHFNEGDRVLIIKKDLSILLHSSEGVKPIQWQLPGAGKVTFSITDDDNLLMETYRIKTDESFFITFSKVHLALTYNTFDVEDNATIMGSEKDFVGYLVKHPDIIEIGIQVITSEKEIDFGFIDIWAKDSSGNPVVIEIKKSDATLADAHQLKRYVDFFLKKGQKTRGILVATGFPKKVKTYLTGYNLDSCTVPWQDIFPTIQRPKSASLLKKLDEFL